jgi:hypothetical protein
MSITGSGGISIGDGKWIPWIDCDQINEVPVNLQLAPLRDLWRKLETNCVADCCGIDAFDFSPANIQRASAELGDPLLSQKLATLRQQIAASDDMAYDSIRFNCSLHRDVLIQLIDHIAAHVAAR